MMTKDDLLKIVTERNEEHEQFYLDFGPDKHEQENNFYSGVNVVGMNVGLLVDWLAENVGGDAEASFVKLPKADRREIWEASDFHFGIMGYTDHDANFWWSQVARD